jgi:hypothetical protein
MATWTSYDEIGVKEDVSDVITRITPTKTPFLSSLKTEKVHQKRHDWQEDALDAVAANAAVEGADGTDQTLVATVLRSNYTQILTKTIKVSGTSDATQAYGRSKESAYQMSKKMAEIKRDLEYALVATNANFNAGTSSVARLMATAFFMIDAGNVIAGGTAALTEAMILSALQQLYTVGGEASILMVKPSDAKIIAGFSGATGRQRQIMGTGTTVTNNVKVYETPFGDVKVVMNRFQLATAALLYDPSYWRLLVLRNWFREVLAKTGDSLKQMLIGEFSLAHKNFKASASITAIT